MTMNEIMAMDEDALRLAVAKACGLTGIYIDPLTIAAASAYALEDALPMERREAYWRRLRWVLQNKDLTDFSGWSLLHASAADRCRAWLLTMEG